MRSLTIGQLAKRANIGVETVRYYERCKLIEEPPRSQSGYRQYPEDTVNRLFFIRRARAAGFSLKEIDALIKLKLDPTRNCASVAGQLSKKIEEIKAEIANLLILKSELVDLANFCNRNKPNSECPIFETWSSDGRQMTATH